MKHVFIINSHTTYLTAMGVINFLKINILDIIIVLVRNYKNKYLNEKYVIIDATSLSNESERVFNRRNFLRNPKSRFISKVDIFISSVIGGEYNLYAPHLAHPLWTILYTNKNCVHFSYIQEGLVPFTTAYVTKTPIKGILENFIYDWISSGRVWFFRPWYLKDHIIDDSKIDAYAINDLFFKYLPVETKIVKWPLPEYEMNVHFEDQHRIFIYDAFVAHHIMESIDYIQMCKNLIDDYATSYNYLKFHPGQSKDEKEIIKSYFDEKGLAYYVLDNAIPFEYVIMAMKNLKLVGYGSTLLYLAHDYGHEVVCRDDDLLKFSRYRLYRKSCGFMSYKDYIKTKHLE